MVVLAVLVLAAALQDSRLPIPSAESQKESEKLIRETFKDEYAKKTPADRLTLAR
jgi:hypothetical protein